MLSQRRRRDRDRQPSAGLLSDSLPYQNVASHAVAAAALQFDSTHLNPSVSPFLPGLATSQDSSNWLNSHLTAVPNVYLINATSLAKCHTLQLLSSDFVQFNTDVRCITETWFTANMSENYTAINGFSLYRRDRKKREGGVVCIYVKDSIQSCIYSVSDDFEVLWVKINFCDNYFYIAACYHPLTQSTTLSILWLSYVTPFGLLLTVMFVQYL